MLKGLRWPFFVLVVASSLLILAILTRPEATQTADLAPTATTVAAVAPVPTTPQPSVLAADAADLLAVLPAAILPDAPENILVEALVGEINKLNPLLATYNPVDRDITALIFEGLTTTNDYGEIIPDLAESWIVSADGLDYILVLRDDVLWHDGIPLSAEDVVLTFNLISDPAFPGADALHEFWRTVEVDQLDNHMVRFRLTQPLASFPDQLRLGIVPAHVLADVPVDKLGAHPFNLAPIGTGPYQIETLTASNGQIDGIQLRVAPAYRQRSEGTTGYELDRIVFQTYSTPAAALEAYRLGHVNSIGSVPAGLQTAALQTSGLSLYTTIEPHVGTLIYNWERVHFIKNPRARLALAHAIDRSNWVIQHLSGTALIADSPLLPDSWAYVPGTVWPDYDLVQAQALLSTVTLEPSLEEAPAPDATEGETDPNAEITEDTTEADAAVETEAASDTAAAPIPASRSYLDLTILTLDTPAQIALAQDIAAGWEQLGFSVSVAAVDVATLHTRLAAGDFDAALVELSFEPNADPDPYVFWHQGQHGTGQNYGNMQDRRISEMLEQARREGYGLNRAAYYREFQTLFAERVPALVLYYPLYFYAVDARLEGLQLSFLSSPSDRFRTIQAWTFAAAASE